MLSSLPSWVDHWATRFPDRPAVIFDDRTITWAELGYEVATWTSRLAEAGVQHGDRVAIVMLNRPEFLTVEWACHALGAVAMPVNTRLAVAELAEILADATPRVAVLEDVEQLAPLVRYLSDEWAGTAIDVDAPGDLPTARAAVGLGRDLDEPAALLYTSGTTGLPKGVTLTLGNLEASRSLWMTEFALTHRDVHLVCMPLCFAGGFIASSKHAIAAGGTMVLMRDFEAGRALELIERHGVTWITSVPIMLERMWKSAAWETADLSSLGGVQSGGAVVPTELVDAFGERGVGLSQAYGLSEATAGPSMYLDETFIRTKPGSVGRAALGFEVRLVDESGDDVAIGDVGELALRGPQVFAGYWRRPDLTEAAMRDDWLLTGDLARCDADGFYYIVGRSKEMIVTGGLNVYPAEVERVIDRAPGVIESAVVGLPSERWGEEVVACVIAAPDLDVDGVLDYARQQLADYKVPKRVIVMEEFPRTLSSKIQRVALRQRLAEGPA